jgi:hypothetical protein
VWEWIDAKWQWTAGGWWTDEKFGETGGSEIVTAPAAVAATPMVVAPVAPAVLIVPQTPNVRDHRRPSTSTSTSTSTNKSPNPKGPIVRDHR